VSNFSKIPFSGSTNGRGVLVVAVATPGTLIHTSVGADHMDEIWLYARNSDADPRDLTIEFGGVTDPDDLIEQQIPIANAATGEGLVLVLPGLILRAGLVVRAFGSVASVMSVFGFVNRITN